MHPKKNIVLVLYFFLQKILNKKKSNFRLDLDPESLLTDIFWNRSFVEILIFKNYIEDIMTVDLKIISSKVRTKSPQNRHFYLNI